MVEPKSRFPNRRNSLPGIKVKRPSRQAKTVSTEICKKTLSPRSWVRNTTKASPKNQDNPALVNRTESEKLSSGNEKKEIDKTEKLQVFRRVSRVGIKRDVPTTSTAAEDDDEGIKTRRVQKCKETGPKCSMCKLNEFDVGEKLKECSNCNSSYHISNCLKYHEDFKKSIWKTKSWLCARCIGCSKCGEFIADPSNVECWTCCRAWHGDCAPNGYRPTDLFDDAWHCPRCSKANGFNIVAHEKTTLTPNKTTDENNSDITNSKKVEEKAANNIKLSISSDEVRALMQERNHHWDRLVDIAGLSSPTKSKHSTPVKLSPVKKQKLFKGEKRGKRLGPSKEHTYDEESVASTSCQNIVTDFDSLLYKQSSMHNKKDLPTVDKLGEGQWVYMGGEKASKAVCPSAYPDEMAHAHIIYVCKFCLHATHLAENYKIHWDNCTWRFPPGNEIYRKGKLSFFEVDGEKQKSYCRNLCLMSKLFISSKTLYHEVETFLFYILCEITSEGFVIVGYFSKEKNPSKNNNLSCLLTLPTSQRMGYGRLLIDMSYALSRLELKIGSPEHPLSDLGILAYRGYWRSSILCYLRSIRHHNHISIKEISISTRIHPVDVVNQMLKDNMLLFKNNSYYIKTGKRAYKHPLSQIRRRTVDLNKLVWKPKKEDIEGLDPTRINFYV